MKRAIVKRMAETTAWRSHCQFITFINSLFTVDVIRQMAPLLSKVDSNKLRHDVQNEETVICAKFGKDMFNISKVIGCKPKWPRFLPARRYASAGNSGRNVSVCPSVRPYVTRRYCVKTKKVSGMISSPSGSPKTLVF